MTSALEDALLAASCFKLDLLTTVVAPQKASRFESLLGDLGCVVLVALYYMGSRIKLELFTIVLETQHPIIL